MNKNLRYLWLVIATILGFVIGGNWNYSAGGVDRSHLCHPLFPRERQGGAQLPALVGGLSHSHHHLVERRDLHVASFIPPQKQVSFC